MSDLSKYHNFFHTWRSFDVDCPVSDSFISEVNEIIESYIKEYNLKVYKDIIVDREVIRILHSASMVEGAPKDEDWKTNTQMLAPLLISVKPTINNDPLTLLHIGRMYSTIGLRAIEVGYKTGFCLCCNQFVLQLWKKTNCFVKKDGNRIIRPIFLCIGNPLNPNKPHNWAHIHNKFHKSYVRTITDHIKVIYE